MVEISVTPLLLQKNGSSFVIEKVIANEFLFLYSYNTSSNWLLKYWKKSDIHYHHPQRNFFFLKHKSSTYSRKIWRKNHQFNLQNIWKFVNVVANGKYINRFYSLNNNNKRSTNFIQFQNYLLYLYALRIKLNM